MNLETLNLANDIKHTISDLRAHRDFIKRILERYPESVRINAVMKNGTAYFRPEFMPMPPGNYLQSYMVALDLRIATLEAGLLKLADRNVREVAEFLNIKIETEGN